MVRRKVIFRGRVQGVFFRGTTEEIALGLPLTGFVRNLPDGSVELQAQGEPQAIERLLAALQSRFGGNITSMESSEVAIAAAESGFRIAR